MEETPPITPLTLLSGYLSCGKHLKQRPGFCPPDLFVCFSKTFPLWEACLAQNGVFLPTSLAEACSSGGPRTERVNSHHQLKPELEQ